MHFEYAIISARAPDDCGPPVDAALVLLGDPSPATPGDFGVLEHAAAITVRAISVTSGTGGRLIWLHFAEALLKSLYAPGCYSGATATVASLLHEMRHSWVVTGRKGARRVLVHE
jgi:hypothetical protein